MSLKQFVPLTALLAFALVTPNLAFADGIGTTVTGFASLLGGNVDRFNPAFGLVAAGYGNSTGSSSLVSSTAAGTAVIIGSGSEFNLTGSLLSYSFDFSGDTLVFTNIETGGTENTISFTFTNPIFTSFTLDGPQGANETFDFTGNTLTLNVLSGNAESSTTTYHYTTVSATPEPGSFVLLGTGVLGVAGTMRRRILAR